MFSVAIAQTKPTANYSENLEVIIGLIAKAAHNGAELIVFPEEALLVGDETTKYRLNELAQSTWDQSLDLLTSVALEYHIAVIVGGYEGIPSSTRPFNTIVAIDTDGRIAARYRKLHLYDAFSYRESDYIVSGEDFPPVVSLAGRQLGLINCYDLRFPEHARYLLDHGAEILCISASWLSGLAKEDHWMVLARARAIENTRWVIASGTRLPDTIGMSMLIDPLGVVRYSASTLDTGLIMGLIDDAFTTTIQMQLPAVANRRIAQEYTICDN